MRELVAIAHGALSLTIYVLPNSGNRNIANWSLEFDQRVGAIVRKLGQSLATSAEVRIMAYGTLVTNSGDIGILFDAKRTIAEDSTVVLLYTRFLRDWLVEWNKTVAWMILVCRFDTLRAIIPVRAVHTLVTNAIDILNSLARYSDKGVLQHTLSQPSQIAQ